MNRGGGGPAGGFAWIVRAVKQICIVIVRDGFLEVRRAYGADAQPLLGACAVAAPQENVPICKRVT